MTHFLRCSRCQGIRTWNSLFSVLNKLRTLALILSCKRTPVFLNKLFFFMTIGVRKVIIASAPR